MANNDALVVYEALLKKCQSNARLEIVPEEVNSLIGAFISTQSTAVRAKAYIILSLICQKFRNSPITGKGQLDAATRSLTKIFSPPIIDGLAATDERSLLPSVTFLIALFQVDWQAATAIFTDESVLESIMDAVDITPSSQLSQDVSHLLGQACGHKPCRIIITSNCIRWLESKAHQSSNASLRAAASVALIKYRQGIVSDESNGAGIKEAIKEGGDNDLAEMMKGMVLTESGLDSLADAVEGLAYLSVKPAIKEVLANDPIFLSKFFALIPHRKGVSPSAPSENLSAVVYGILVVITNLCAHRPLLTEEQMQVERLKRMAKAGKGTETPSEDELELDDDKHVNARIHRLVESDVLDVLSSALSKSDSSGIKSALGRTFLNIVEVKELRGKVLQSGGAKVLGLIIKQAIGKLPSTVSKQPSLLDVADLDAIQALAKLTITSSPVQVFGPDVGAMINAVRPLCLMLLHSSSKQLQRFEAILALTNLSSYSAELATRISKFDGCLNAIELLLLDDHALLQRAATELLCNFIAGSDEVFERYGGDINPDLTKSRIHVLLALSDVEDLPTRLAASGALATLTTSPAACKTLFTLQMEKRRVWPIVTQLIDSSALSEEHREDAEDFTGHPGLVHRGVVCARNIFYNLDEESRKAMRNDAMSVGLLRAVSSVIKESKEMAVLQPAAEILKALGPTNSVG